MTTPTGVKPIVTPMPGEVTTILPGEADAEAAALEAARVANLSPAEIAAEEAAKGKTPDQLAAEAAAKAAGKTDDLGTLSLDDDDATTDDTTQVDFEATGYAEFDSVGKLLADKKVANANQIMNDFLETGELSLEHKASMIAALGENVAMMAITQMENKATSIVNEAREDTRKSMDYANTKFNGKDAAETWQQIKEYVRNPDSKFTPADLATMNAMLAQGGLQAQLVIDRIYQTYTNDSNVSQPGTLLEGDAGGAGNSFEPISRIDYTAEMGKAVGKYGEDSPQVRALDRRRVLSMKAGY